MHRSRYTGPAWAIAYAGNTAVYLKHFVAGLCVDAVTARLRFAPAQNDWEYVESAAVVPLCCPPIGLPPQIAEGWQQCHVGMRWRV